MNGMECLYGEYCLIFYTRSHSKKICQAAKTIRASFFLERVGSGGGGLGFSYQEIRSLGTKGGRVMLQVDAEEYFSRAIL